MVEGHFDATIRSMDNIFHDRSTKFEFVQIDPTKGNRVIGTTIETEFLSNEFNEFRFGVTNTIQEQILRYGVNQGIIIPNPRVRCGFT